MLVLSVHLTKISPKQCCSSIVLDSHLDDHKVIGNRLGFYKQLGRYGARPAYKWALGCVGWWSIVYISDRREELSSSILMQRKRNGSIQFSFLAHRSWTNSRMTTTIIVSTPTPTGIATTGLSSSSRRRWRWAAGRWRKSAAPPSTSPPPPASRSAPGTPTTLSIRKVPGDDVMVLKKNFIWKVQSEPRRVQSHRDDQREVGVPEAGGGQVQCTGAHYNAGV